ncbi:MAG: SDR family NAD(P)-dependent oxidoreductase [Veillonellaceae bacterium]|nr:SDR family NAD(P)-dependent oxidoreductase [Veillonellaceae bacterium]
MSQGTVMITGASSGIGRATARLLAEKGYDLILAARREDILTQDAAAWEKEYGVTVRVYPLDVTKRAMVERVCEQIVASGALPDVLINNAGLARELAPFHENELDDIEEMLHTNVRGLMYVTRALLPAMIERNSGHIVNLGSTAGLAAYAGGTVYCATKAAVKMLSDGIRIDTIATDIKVTTIMPGLVETPFSEVRFRGDTERAAAVYAGVEALTPEDIADTIEFVISRPRRMQISDVTIMANQQATGYLIHKE